MSNLSFLQKLPSAVILSAVLSLAGPVLAEIPKPIGNVVLKIDGAVDAEEGTSIDLDLNGLKHLAAVSFVTSTIWTEGDQKFTGVPLKALIEAAGGKGDTVVAEALNGYAVDIPMDQLESDAPIVAYLINDETFSRRDKGPLWVVFPYDSDERYKSETTYAYSIWQLHRLTVK